MRNFTPEDLIQFYYHELPEEKAAYLQERMRTDWTLVEKLDVIAEAAERLELSLNKPHRRSLESIFAYAAQNKEKMVDSISAA